MCLEEGRDAPAYGFHGGYGACHRGKYGRDVDSTIGPTSAPLKINIDGRGFYPRFGGLATRWTRARMQGKKCRGRGPTRRKHEDRGL